MLPLVQTIEHPVSSLSTTIRGELDREAHLALFRGIPYATVQKRWTHSKKKDRLENPFDATSFGPRCVQGEGQVLVSGGINDPVPGDHEFDCLNLNISTPVSALQKPVEKLLPVMVWIHGGAFHYGANSVARYRPNTLLSIAAEAGTPVVLVQIGYRLGPLGFAASTDLSSESKTESPATGDLDSIAAQSTGSYGFVDQRNAFKWVKDHIRDFGGDPANVTAFGVSAGSASVHFHILTGDPLFDRAIMMSGAASTLGPLPRHFYEVAWTEMCEKLNIADQSPEARLEHLRSLGSLEMINSYSKAAMGPMGDDGLLPSSWKFSDATSTRCKSIILGDTQVEAIILDGLFKSVSQKAFQKLVCSSFTDEQAAGFAQAFGFSLVGEQPMEQYLKRMRHFFSVMMFQYPNIGIAETRNSSYETYLYHFEEPSPYPGPTYGVPYHGQCALYMHCNEIDVYPASGKQIAHEMVTIWTAFAHGKQPWEPYSKGGRFLRFGPGGSTTMKSIEDDGTRDYAYIPWLRDNWSATETLARRFLQGEGRS